MIRILYGLLDAAGRRLFRAQVALIVAYAVLQGLAFLLMVPILRTLLEGDPGAAARWTGVLAVTAAAAGVAFYAQAMLAHRLGGVVARTLHRRLGDHLATLPLGWFGPERVGEVGRLAGQGVTDAMTGAGHLLRPLIAAVVTPVTVVAAMFVLDWRLALVTALTIPPIYAAHRLSGHLARREAGAVQGAAAEAGARIVEYAQNQRALRAFGRSGERNAQVRAALDAQHAARRRQLWTMSVGLVGTAVAVQLAFLVVLVVGVEMALRGSVPVPELVALLVLVARFGQPLVEAADIVGALRVVGSSLRGIERVLASPALPESAAPRVPAGSAVRLDDVHFAYDDRSVLDGFTLEIPPRATVALVGPSGAGKTTVARLIARFWDADGGAVTIGGVDVRDIAPAALMDRIAMVFQDVYLFDATIEENIRIGRPDATDHEVRDAARRARVDEIAARLPHGWATPVGEGGALLSGGERQRVSIARAILKDAPIVLLDEATAALDVENEAAVQQAVADLARDRSVLVIAHRLATVTAADCIAFVDGGRVVEQGTHEELLALGGRYAGFWQRRLRARGWRLAGAAYDPGSASAST